MVYVQGKDVLLNTLPPLPHMYTYMYTHTHTHTHTQGGNCMDAKLDCALSAFAASTGGVGGYWKAVVCTCIVWIQFWPMKRCYLR